MSFANHCPLSGSDLGGGEETLDRLPPLFNIKTHFIPKLIE
jgi:hypothetical protein